MGSKRWQCCCWLTSRDLRGLCPISSHFTHLPCATGTPSATVLVVVLRGGGFVYFWALWQHLPPSQPPLGLQPEVMRPSFSLHWSPGLHSLAWRWAHSLSRSLPDFSPPYANAGLPAPQGTVASLPQACCCHTESSPTLLPIWVIIVPLSPLLLDSPTVLGAFLGDFLAVLGVFIFKLVLFLLMVV